MKYKLLPAHKTSDSIRSFLKKSDISAIDMIKHLSQAMGFVVSTYELNPEDIFDRAERISDSLYCDVGISLALFLHINDQFVDEPLKEVNEKGEEI